MQTSNIFMNMILEKVPFSIKNLFKYLKHKKKIKSFLSDIQRGSPEFGLLWKMADFIKYAEEVFFYDNNSKNTEMMLYSSKGYVPGQNGFKINHPEVFMVVKLFSDTQRVVVEMERTNGERMKTILNFANNEWDGEHTAYDEMLLEQVIKIINSSIINLFEWCYSKR